jgi:glyoxylase-like metal-dependent hydrolase (beta-lactamase superfamily II)
MEPVALAGAEIGCLRAANPGPLTLTGTNSWVVGRDPCWVIDPGPDLDTHLDALAAEVAKRGGAGGIALTHTHADHAAGVDGLLERLPAPVPVAGADPRAATGASSARELASGERFGPLRVMALPGHARDHLGYLVDSAAGTACFTGDAVLGEGSVFVGADMAAYLEALERLQALAPVVLCPGHGPLVTRPEAHLAAYREHRLAREREIESAWRRGIQDEHRLVAEIWGPLPERLAHAAIVTLRAHLAKLEDEGRLTPGAA